MDQLQKEIDDTNSELGKLMPPMDIPTNIEQPMVIQSNLDPDYPTNIEVSAVDFSKFNKTQHNSEKQNATANEGFDEYNNDFLRTGLEAGKNGKAVS